MLNWLKSVLTGVPAVNFEDLIENGATIIDVRTPQEYKGGHVSKSKNIPLQVISGKATQIKKLPQPIITVCASGMRSGQAANILKSAGIEAYNGGSWIKFR